MNSRRMCENFAANSPLIMYGTGTDMNFWRSSPEIRCLSPEVSAISADTFVRAGKRNSMKPILTALAVLAFQFALSLLIGKCIRAGRGPSV